MIDNGQFNEALRIARTGTGIAKIDGSELKKKSKVFLSFIFKDLGLREQVGDYEIGRFLDYLTKYYKFITIPDIKLMFELYVIGALPNVKDHWGKWSANFYISVVKSYIVYQNKKRQEDIKALPMPKTTQEEINEIRSEFESYLVNVYKMFLSTGKLKDRNLGLPVYRYWFDKGYLSEVEITESDLTLSLLELVEEKKTPDAEIGETQKQSRSNSNAMRRMVRELYCQWAEDGVNIKDKM